MFKGSIVALVTPMSRAGGVDFDRLQALIEMHIEEGTDAIVVNGSTGEAHTLAEDETNRLIQVAVQTAAQRIPIIAGTGSASTADTIRKTAEAKSLGVDACLIVTPYYNRPTQEGLYQHYKMIAEATAVPIILYNVPTRTSCDLLPETVQRLAELPYIIGIKEATGNMARAKALMPLSKVMSGQFPFALYSGDDPSALAFMLQGGQGVISITANVAPRLMHAMCMAALKGDIKVAGELNARLMPLHKLLCIESNPIPVKWVLAKMGWIEEGIRLPLTPLSSEHHLPLMHAMQHAGVVS